jgi:hypothetical protein
MPNGATIREGTVMEGNPMTSIDTASPVVGRLSRYLRAGVAVLGRSS